MNNFQTALHLLVVAVFLATACKKTDTTENPGNNTSTNPNKQKVVVAYNPEGTIESKPLSESKPQGSTSDKLFSRLDPKKTGVNFINPILKDNPRAYLYASAMGCGGVSVGDVNGDGRPDLFLTGGPVPNQLLIQTDTLKFTDFTQQAGLAGNKSWGTGSSIIDIDKDGDLDIYVCNYDSANELYINQGSGKFIESAKSYGLDFISAGHTPAFSDYDMDGDLDLYLMTNFFYDPRGKTPPNARIVGRDKSGKVIVMPEYENSTASPVLTVTSLIMTLLVSQTDS